MKKWLIEWETRYCEDYPEKQGEMIVEAETKEEAEKQFNVFHAVITNIREVDQEGKSENICQWYKLNMCDCLCDGKNYNCKNHSEN